MNKIIEGFPNYYVTTTGEIINLKGKILKSRKINSGYLLIHLNHLGIRKAFLVHRLVAFHFIYNPLNKKYVNHKDGNKLNNNVDNLEWVTNSENMKHAFDNGFMENSKIKAAERMKILGHKFGNGERMIFYTMKKIKPVFQLDLNGNILNEFISIKEAQRQTGAKNIHKVLTNKFTHSGGFKWKYK